MSKDLIKLPIEYSAKTNTPYMRIPEEYLPLLIHRNVKECFVQPIDSRRLSEQQRKMCYALIREISEYTGEEHEREKEFLKLEFMAERVEQLGDKIFSLSDAPMSLVAGFQKYLIRFIVDNDIPTKFSLLEYVDDINDYVYACLINKKCCICGKRADLHHVDQIGMGNDRTEVTHEGREVLPLCREHHTEYHTVGKRTFFEKYHLDCGIKLDKTLLKIYRLKK